MDFCLRLPSGPSLTILGFQLSSGVMQRLEWNSAFAAWLKTVIFGSPLWPFGRALLSFSPTGLWRVDIQGGKLTDSCSSAALFVSPISHMQSLHPLCKSCWDSEAPGSWIWSGYGFFLMISSLRALTEGVRPAVLWQLKAALSAPFLSSFSTHSCKRKEDLQRFLQLYCPSFPMAFICSKKYIFIDSCGWST